MQWCRWSLSVAVLATACSTSLDVGDAEVQCASDAGCPGRLECRDGLCVDPSFNGPPVVGVLPISPPGGGRYVDLVNLDFSLSDPEGDGATVELDVSTDFDPATGMGNWSPAVVAGGALSGVLAAPRDGQSYSVQWDATQSLATENVDESGDEVADVPVVVGADNVFLRFRASDSSASEIFSEAVVGPLAVGNTAPSAVLDPIGGESSGAVPLVITTVDDEFDSVELEVQFLLPQDAPDGWRTIAVGLGVETTNLTPGRVVVVWDSLVDLQPLFETPQGVGERTFDDVRVRVRAVDTPLPGVDLPSQRRHFGAWNEQVIATLRNQTRPQIRDVLLLRDPSRPITGPVPIRYRVVDEESDPVDIQCSVSLDRGTTWQTCVEYRSPQSEGRYDLATAPSGRFDAGGVEHVFMWDAGALVIPDGTSTTIRLRVSDGVSGNWDEVLFEEGNAGPLAARFEPFSDFTAGSSPEDLFFGDLTGDGIGDAVTVNRSAAGISVLLGTGTGVGDGGLGPPNAFSAGDTPVALAVVDVDGDGIADVITANRNDDNVAVLLGQGTGVGNGMFGAPSPFATGVEPWDLVVADVNGDDVLDILTVHVISEQVMVLLGQGGVPPGNGTFGSPTPVDIGAGTSPRVLAVAEVSGDGVPDLLTGNFGPDDVALLLGVGDGTFGAPQYLGAGNQPQALLATDLSGDGILDIVTVGNARTVSVHLGQGFNGVPDGSFGPSLESPLGLVPSNMAAADLDGDTIPDLLVACGASAADSGVLLLTGQNAGGVGSGFFQSPQVFPTGRTPEGTVIDDLNGDGVPDAVVASATDGTINVLLGAGSRGSDTGTFDTPRSLAIGDSPRTVLAEDFDRDGVPDILVTNFNSEDVSVLRATQSTGFWAGSFEAIPGFSVGPNVRLLVADDVNGDGLSDLIATSDVVTVHLGGGGNGIGDGTFLAGQPYTMGSILFGLAVVDVSGDGIADLLTTNRGSGTLSVRLGLGSGGVGNGAFDNEQTFSAGTAPRGLAVADVDDDGILDVVTADSTNDILVLLGQGDSGVGDGTFGSPQPYASGVSVSLSAVVRAADLNADGILDILTHGATEVAVLLGGGASGVGDGTFFAAPPYATGFGISTLEVSDVSGDGFPDIIASGNTGLRVLLGQGLGGVPSGSFALGYSVTANAADSVVITDLNADDISDLLLVETTLDNLRHFLGLGGTAARQRWLFPELQLRPEDFRSVGADTVDSRVRADRLCDARLLAEQTPGVSIPSDLCDPVYWHGGVSTRVASEGFSECAADEVSLPKSVVPLGVAVTVHGDVRLTRVTVDDPATDAGHRLRAEPRFGPYQGAVRVGLDATSADRGIVVPLRIARSRCIDTAPANGQCDFIDDGRTVHVVRRVTDWVRADALPCGAAVPPASGSSCSTASPPPLCDPFAMDAEAFRYLPRVPECEPSTQTVVYRDVVQKRYLWEEIPVDPNGVLDDGVGSRFTVLEGPSAADPHYVLVLTDALGTFQAFLD